VGVLESIKAKAETDNESDDDNFKHIVEEVGELAGKLRRSKKKIREESADVAYEAMKMFFRKGGSVSELEVLLLDRITRDKGTQCGSSEI
jgi:phosphoribosyl-ATP pyrophosphohydrolase